MKKIEYLGTDFEKKICEPYWKSYFDNPDKLHKACDLLKEDLDAQECEKIDLIIERLRRILDGNQIIFTLPECKTIIDMENNFYPKIKKYSYQEREYFQWGKYKLWDENFDMSVFYYLCGMTELNNIKNISNKDIIDAGAYIGDSSIVLANYTKSNIHAFEAYYDNFIKIEKTCTLNGLDRVIPVNKAVSDKDDDVLKFYIRAEGETGHGLLKRDGISYNNQVDCRTITIDKYVKEHNLQIGLIKSDIEGAEKALIRGAAETICEQKPALLISIYHTADDFFEIKRMIEDLGIGYHFKIFQPISRRNIFLETMLVCEVYNENN